MASKSGQGFVAASDDNEVAPGEWSSARNVLELSLAQQVLGVNPGVLPIGFFVDGERKQEFTLKPYGGKQELALSSLFKKVKNNVGEALPAFLELVIDKIDGQTLHELASSKSLSVRRFLEGMYLADAIQVLLELRVAEFGSEICLTASCPNCRHANKDREGEYTDLGSLELGRIDGELDSPYFRLALEGVDIHGERIDHVILRPSRISDIQRMGKERKDRSEYGIEYELMFFTVAAIPQSTYLKGRNADGSGVSDTNVEELYGALNARDRRSMLKAVQKIVEIGPEMNVDYVCGRCQTEFKTEVPWSNLPAFLSLVD